MRRSNAIRAVAWGVVAAGVLAPLVRRRVNAPALATQAVAYSAPVALCVAVRRSPYRDVATCFLQMWAYLGAYKAPHDDPEALRRRVRVDYPIAIDRVIGLGELPTIRLQRALARTGPDGPRWRVLDKLLVWTHWAWFMVPHGTLLYLLLLRRERFERAAVMTYAVFDLGALVYWWLPTAPPWYPAARACELAEPDEGGAVEVSDATPGIPDETAVVRRMMLEYGEFFWGDSWGPLYSVLGGNPLAAMPSLHFATSMMAAQLLSESGPVAGALGWTYASALGFALVYLGEHYVVDLIAGAALTTGVRKLGPRAGPALTRASRAVAALEAAAHGV